MPDPDDTEERPGRTKGRQRARGRTTPLTAVERERVRQLARDGLSARKIAAEVGCSPTTVSRFAGDLLGERRAQTAAASEARTVDFAAERLRLMEQTLKASRLAMQRFVRVEGGDHRGSLDEARAFNAMIGAYSKLDERHARAQGTQGFADVDAYMAHILGGRPAAEYTPSYDDDGEAG